jgi:hypothetical protein
MKEFEGEEDGPNEDEKLRLFIYPERKDHRCQKWTSDISYVSDTSTKPDRGVFTAEPLKSGVDILP